MNWYLSVCSADNYIWFSCPEVSHTKKKKKNIWSWGTPNVSETFPTFSSSANMLVSEKKTEKVLENSPQQQLKEKNNLDGTSTNTCAPKVAILFSMRFNPLLYANVKLSASSLGSCLERHTNPMWVKERLKWPISLINLSWHSCLFFLSRRRHLNDFVPLSIHQCCSQ